MSVIVFVIGESGTGKSTSMRNCNPAKWGVINVSGKPLPFKSKLNVFNTDNYDKIKSVLSKATAKSIVIDDSQYLMVNAFMRRTDKGYDKFTELAQAHWGLIDFVARNLPNDKIVYLMSHIERDTLGNEKVKTVGKMLDQFVTLEGLATIVLKTKVSDGKYFFTTQNSGFDTVKTPMGMFEDAEIDNDLQMVDDRIREYYELDGGNKE